MNLFLLRPTLAVVIAASMAAACGHGDSGSSPSQPPTETLIITIAANGASPRNIVVPQGAQVTFVNQDRSVHQMYSDPHPEHTDCPEFDSVGQLAAGQSRQTTNLITVRVCRFHDHLNPADNALTGSVTIR